MSKTNQSLPQLHCRVTSLQLLSSNNSNNLTEETPF